jgi:SAM-dependent methyltransferase
MARTVKRHALQGVWTVVRFNWHLQVAALALAAVFLSAPIMVSGSAAYPAIAAGLGVIVSIILSLVATWWAYDASGLYQMDWLLQEIEGTRRAAIIHAGFDECSEWLETRFPETSLHVFDFYDPAKHTEISIRRARKASPAVPGTIAVRTESLPLTDASLDRVLLFLAAHEIRDHSERVAFFREIRRVLNGEGRVIVTEHLRDAANIVVYSLGAWHFHTRQEWLSTFDEAGFRVVRSFRNNHFITTFILEPS